MEYLSKLVPQARLQLPPPTLGPPSAATVVLFMADSKPDPTLLLVWGSCSRTIQRFGEKSPDMVPQISITIGFQKKNSSDLDMGQCPKLKSDEFSFETLYLFRRKSRFCVKNR